MHKKENLLILRVRCFIILLNTTVMTSKRRLELSYYLKKTNAHETQQ